MTSTPDVDGLLETASAQTGLTDFGDLPFREALGAQLWSLVHEAGHPAERLPQLMGGLVAILVKRLRLVDDRKKNPEIAAETITAPIVVLGLPRTGSTHLHALLAAAPGARAPQQWELNEPSPPPKAETYGADPRIARVQAELDARPGAAELQAAHPYGAQRPEQCLGLIDWSFVNTSVLALHRMPAYFEWFLAADHRPAYEHHRRMLQHLQWRAPGPWRLKSPKHVLSLEALLATYPDARIVWTHRDPVTVVPSVANFVGTIRRLSSPLYDPRRFGAEWSGFEEIGLLRGVTTRERSGDERQFYDLHYNDFMADPVGAVGDIYRHFGLEFSEASRAALDRFQAENPQGKHGAHSYTAEQYGLTPEGLRRRFGFYIDRFGVEPDRRR